MQVAVSFLKSQEPTDITIKRLDQTDCDYIHVDVMDGVFVPQKTGEIHKYLENTKKKLDVHLQKQDTEFLAKIIEQNKIIINQNKTIIELLTNPK